jgi:hypothetical protein
LYAVEASFVDFDETEVSGRRLKKPDPDKDRSCLEAGDGGLGRLGCVCSGRRSQSREKDVDEYVRERGQRDIASMWTRGRRNNTICGRADIAACICKHLQSRREVHQGESTKPENVW